MAQEPVTVNSTYEFYRTILKDGAAWDLSAAAVTVLFRKPDGTLLAAKTATVHSPATAGNASYTTTTSDLDAAGTWTVTFKIVDGSVSVQSQPEVFEVYAAP